VKKVLTALTTAFLTVQAFAAEHGEEHAVDMGALWKNFGFRVLVFVLLVYILVKLAKKPLLDFLDKRTADIEKAIKDADEAAANAKAELAEYEIKMKGFEKDLETMKENSLKAAEAEKAQILEDASRQVDKLKAFAENLIESEVKRAKVQLKKDAVMAAVSAAEARIGTELDADKQKKLLDDYIKKIEVAG